jgi:hypothetical protein
VRTSIRHKILAIAALIAVGSSGWINQAAGESAFDLSATNVTIFAPDSQQVIGDGHYNLSHIDGLDVVEGENKYLDGEYDHEKQRLRPSVGGLPPVLVDYQHRYFNADGTLQYEESLDSRTGDASCKFYNSSVPDIRETSVKIPPDTYAGATQLMLLVGRLREAAPNITFHSFNCIPDPRIVAVKATPQSGPTTWPMYPGNLVKMEMKPDFGWLNVVVAPFIPKVFAWFDPANSFNYVGGQFDRYFKGRHVLMVRTHDPNPVAQSSAAAPSAR